MNIRPPHEPPRRIQVRPTDNVAIVVNDLGLAAGTQFPDGLTLNQFVPQGHKLALRDIGDGAEIIRYGEVIGTAKGTIKRGDWIDESKIRIRPAPSLTELELATRPPPPPEAPDRLYLRGLPQSRWHRRHQEHPGYLHQCAMRGRHHGICPEAHQEPRCCQNTLKVDDRREFLTHAYGCGVAIDAPNATVPIRTLQSLARNPNFGGEVMVVGLGCEKLAPERLYPDGQGHSMRMQDQAFSGFGSIIDGILAMADACRLKILNERNRETVPASELVVGMQCGGSDAFTGLTANPALGFCADLLVRAGATVMFSEVTEVRDAIHLLTPRAATPEIAQALIRELAWYDAYLAQGGADRAANTSPGQQGRRARQHHRKGPGLGRRNRAPAPSRPCWRRGKKSASAGWYSPPPPPAISFAAPCNSRPA